ncbi:glutamate--tRNA ligase, partial [Pandoraea pneumonica]
PAPSAEDMTQHMTDAARAAVKDLAAALAALTEWKKEAISPAFKATLAQHGMKMPQLAMPVRLLVVGTTHTPAIDAVLELL